MDPFIVLAAGIILVVTGAIDPLIKNKEDVAQAPKRVKDPYLTNYQGFRIFLFLFLLQV